MEREGKKKESLSTEDQVVVTNTVKKSQSAVLRSQKLREVGGSILALVKVQEMVQQVPI
jgi:hypothetical protein